MTSPLQEDPGRLLLLTAREAADYLRVSLSTLHRMEQRGWLAPLRTPGGHRRYTVEMLNECLTRNPEQAESQGNHGSGEHPGH